VRREFGLVFATQAARNLSGQPSQRLVCRIDQAPIALDGLRLCYIRFHVVLSEKTHGHKKPQVKSGNFTGFCGCIQPFVGLGE
jgi:hypothetical protein